MIDLLSYNLCEVQTSTQRVQSNRELLREDLGWKLFRYDNVSYKTPLPLQEIETTGDIRGRWTRDSWTLHRPHRFPDLKIKTRYHKVILNSSVYTNLTLDIEK